MHNIITTISRLCNIPNLLTSAQKYPPGLLFVCPLSVITDNSSYAEVSLINAPDLNDIHVHRNIDIYWLVKVFKLEIQIIGDQLGNNDILSTSTYIYIYICKCRAFEIM